MLKSPAGSALQAKYFISRDTIMLYYNNSNVVSTEHPDSK